MKGKTALAVEDFVWSYFLFGAAVGQLAHPTAEMSRSPEPESMHTGKSTAGVPTWTVVQ